MQVRKRNSKKWIVGLAVLATFLFISGPDSSYAVKPISNPCGVTKTDFTGMSTVSQVMKTPAFKDFGRLLFPVGRPIPDDMTLSNISSPVVYVGYTNVKTKNTVEIANYLKRQAEQGKKIFYPIYSEQERKEDAAKADTGLFYFRGRPGEKYAILSAGGGFLYVAAMQDSFPQALELSKQGYNAFALIYRPDHPYEDLARAMAYVHDHADELHVDSKNYSLWGGSAGGRMTAMLGKWDNVVSYTGRTDIDQAAAVILQYTDYDAVSADDPPTYICVGSDDTIVDWHIMKQRSRQLEAKGIPVDFYVYPGLQHGFGLGTGTVAEGWVTDAIAFWEAQSRCAIARRR